MKTSSRGFDVGAYGDGVQARRERKKMNDCPHPFGTFKREVWRAGWLDQDHLIAMGVDRDTPNTNDSHGGER